MKKGAVLPTYEDFVEMDSNALKQLKTQLLAKGPQGINTVANIIKILAERGEK